MQLWTWHKPDFSLLEGRVDHEKSEYVQTVEGVREAYRELVKRIGTDQFIWCYTKSNQRIVLPHHTEKEWILEVPSTKILKFVDDIIWNRILGIKNFDPPAELKRKWKEKSIARYPYDPVASKKLAKSWNDEFYNQEPPTGNWWDNLFVCERSDECVSALIPHPIKHSYVKINPRQNRSCATDR
jgi:hypothetical protein